MANPYGKYPLPNEIDQQCRCSVVAFADPPGEMDSTAFLLTLATFKPVNGSLSSNYLNDYEKTFSPKTD
ncbi:hypothetical protein TNCV_3604951 [Trichonephila clavipes]|nr:hypothetical protein TNCV_3604951 [Trichonephila clavipes]